MQVARWPNVGWVRGEGPGPVPAKRGTPRPVLTYDQDDLERPEQPTHWIASRDAWLHVLWGSYEESYEHLQSLNCTPDPDEKSLCEFEDPLGKGESYWAVLNVLEELDQPGEYFFDQHAETLYFWPPVLITSSNPVFVSTLGGSLIDIVNASFIELRGLTLEAGRGNGVSIGGATTNNRVVGCALRNLGASAVHIQSSCHSGVLDSDIRHVANAVTLMHGSAGSWAEYGMFVKDSLIQDATRWCMRGYAISIHNGKNNVIEHNSIRNLSGGAIEASGSEHKICYNAICDVARATSDDGAVYIGSLYSKDQKNNNKIVLSTKGILVRNNLFTGHPAACRPFAEDNGLAVYLDNCASQHFVEHNIFRGLSKGVAVYGGADNRVANNVFDQVGTPIEFGDRSKGTGCIWPGGGLPPPPSGNIVDSNAICTSGSRKCPRTSLDSHRSRRPNTGQTRNLRVQRDQGRYC
jgi:hypothetical protein